MAYSSTNPPVMWSPAPLTGAGQTWRYHSTHTAAEVSTGAGFFSNGQDLGMRVFDGVAVSSTTMLITWHSVTTVSSTGATVSVGTTVGSTVVG